MNLLSTLLIVRWFGAGAYAHYIVDLAFLSLILIILEIVPSNFSVFRVQDDIAWRRVIAAQVAATAPLLVLIVGGVSVWTGAFQEFSYWMIPYAASMAFKKYLDINLQASGRLREFMFIELVVALGRIALLLLFFLNGIGSNDAVWSSLALATMLAHLSWSIRNRGELIEFSGAFDRNVWRQLISEMPSYFPYYAGIFLKRIKDSLIPLLAVRIFESRDLLAAFFLAYRGVQFSVGQIRLLEAMMSHRAALHIVSVASNGRKYLLALMAQVLCLIASFLMLFISGLNNVAWLSLVILSFIVWPIVMLVLERAKAYSSYRASRVNLSLISYMAVICAGSVFLHLAGIVTVNNFAALLLLAESCSWGALKISDRYVQNI